MALSNPDPEIEPADALAHGAAIAADGKGINNVLAFPGLFKGALAARAPRFTDAMLLAAARRDRGTGAGRGPGARPARPGGAPGGGRGRQPVIAARSFVIATASICRMRSAETP